MRKIQILKEEVILLIAIAMVYSSVAVTADTIENTSIQNITQIKGNMEYTIQDESSGNRQGVLWDNGGWSTDVGGNCKGEYTFFGKKWLEIADDFYVDSPKGWTVTDGHFEGLCKLKNLQVDSVLVRFFNDAVIKPEEIPFFVVYSTDFTETDYFDPSSGYYHTEIDVNFTPVLLSQGWYWVQFTPVGCDGDWHWQAYSTMNKGVDCCHRDGDPSGGYEGGYGSYTWINFVSGRDVCFKLTGYIGSPPSKPTITGQTKGEPKTAYTWKFNSIDPEGGNVRYHIDWGDNTSEWTGFFPASTPVDVIHTYSKAGSYIITAYAEDEDGNVGPENTFIVTMPKNKAIDRPLLNFVQNFLQNHPNVFPILQHLRGL